MSDDRTELLRIGMDLMVPLWITKVARWSMEERQAAANAAADLISCGADQMRENNPRKRDIPRGAVTNSIAQGLAMLAYGPGGVDWAGSHWCTEPHPGCPLRAERKRVR